MTFRSLLDRAAHSIIVMTMMMGTLSQVIAESPDPAALAARIDQHLENAWTAAGVQPAPAADDATFLRRVHLDLVGRIPTVAEVRQYLADTDPAKRSRLIKRLLGTAAHARHMASFWRRTWIPQTDTPQFSALGVQVDDWLAAHLKVHTPYDDLATYLLTAEGFVTDPGKQVSGQLLGPSAFLLASEFKPENLAANSARAFLGINLDCAECHDHPFARWSRDQFWQTAAFFAKPSPVLDGQPRLEIGIPQTEKIVPATLLNGEQLILPEHVDADTGRKILATWIASADNPYFARNAVNRVWASLYGLGIVEPLDDLTGANPPSHPELLDELAQSFVQSDFSLSYLTEAIVLSRGYGLKSTGGSQANADLRTFAEMPIRGLTGEQLYDSLRSAAGLPAERDDLDSVRAMNRRQRFVAQFHSERTIVTQRSITQALTLMNGDLSKQLTDERKSPLLAAVAGSPFLDRREKVETVFLAALSRKPTEEELSQLIGHLDSRSTSASESTALSNIFWALLNSSEFNTNH